MKETWKKIDNYEDYFISNFGNIKRLRNGREVPYKTFVNKKRFNYIQVGIWKDHKKHTFLIHRLVSNHFIPKVKNKNIINHKDGNKNNNRVDNLEWCTYRENIIHAYKNGLMKVGEDGGNNKLKNKDIYFIRKSDLTQYKLSNMFNVSQSNISSIKTNKTWKHLIHQGQS